jgi:hypothetical protein
MLIHFPLNTKTVRIINRDSIQVFISHLSQEVCDDAFSDNDVDTLFKAFVNGCVRTLNAAFPTVMVHNFLDHEKKKNWVTKAIKIQCNLKRDLYLLSRNSNNLNLKDYYKHTVNYYPIISLMQK